MSPRAAIVGLLVAAALATSTGCGGTHATAPPPARAPGAGAWPTHNLDLSNTRATVHTRIDARDVSKLKQQWTFELPYAGAWGSFTSNPIVADGVVGHIRWKHTFTTLDAGAATVANDVVFTSTYDGTIYAFSAKTGSVLWRTKAPAGVNSFPAVTKTMLIVGAGALTSTGKPVQGQIVAYSLPPTR